MPITDAALDTARSTPHAAPLEWEPLWSAMRTEWHGARRWIPTTEAMFYDQLSAVPPECHRRGCFLVGEAWNHTPAGEAIYAAFGETETGYSARYMTRAEFVAAFSSENSAK